MLSLTPINWFIRQEAELTVARLYRDGHWIAADRDVGHARILSDLKTYFSEIEMPSDYVQTVFKFEKNFDTVFPDRTDWKSEAFAIGESCEMMLERLITSEEILICSDNESAINVRYQRNRSYVAERRWMPYQ